METIGQFNKVRSYVDFKAMRLDVVSDVLHYLGYADPAAATSEAKWQVRRLTLTVEGSIIVQWADGNTEFDNVWDNRASLTYT